MNKLKERAQRLKTDIPAVFIALKDKKTPWFAKVLAFLVVVYALSPIDLIPDFIPILGYLDDLIILPVLIVWCIRCIPDEVFADCRARSQDLWGNGAPQKWYYSIPFVLIWLAVIMLILIVVM
ncbi:MAG: DUF1232 domain-containing protein [Clostridiales bacterium]|nr:DUF1232 domain-containing protein [Clostridiales bacterium]